MEIYSWINEVLGIPANIAEMSVQIVIGGLILAIIFFVLGSYFRLMGSFQDWKARKYEADQKKVELDYLKLNVMKGGAKQP